MKFEFTQVLALCAMMLVLGFIAGIEVMFETRPHTDGNNVSFSFGNISTVGSTVKRDIVITNDASFAFSGELHALVTNKYTIGSDNCSVIFRDSNGTLLNEYTISNAEVVVPRGSEEVFSVQVDDKCVSGPVRDSLDVYVSDSAGAVLQGSFGHGGDER